MVLSRYTGARVRRKEDPRLITGSATYVDDVRLPGMTHLVVVRSPYAHARINGIDSSRAQAMPGVLAVITGEALRAVCGPLSTASEGGGSDGTGKIPKPPIYAMATDTVRYVGEPVAAVIAMAPDTARDAADAVDVDYVLLSPVVDPEQARQPGAPQLYDQIENNVGMRWSRTEGEVEDAFERAAVVVKQRIRSQRLAGVPMEGRAVVAAPDGATGGLIVWTSTQAPHWSRNDIAKALGLGQNEVRVIAPEVGGAFGVKIGAYPEDFIVAAAAVMLKRPVKWIETRTESFQATHHGRDQIADIELAAGRDGTIAALRLNVLQDLGSHPKGTDLPELTGKMATGCYVIPAVEFRAEGVYTTTMAVGAYRGAGRPEAAYYIERAIDLLAGELGMDPAEVRRVNFIPPERFPYQAAPGVEYDSGNYARALNTALDAAGYRELRREQKAQREQGRYLGIGLASYVEICAFGPWESSTVRVEPGGAVTVFTGISPHGQGQETSFAQLVADHLGADFDRVVVHHGDTGNTPQGNGTMGSRGLVLGGGALMLSLDKLREKACRIAAHLLEASPEDVELAEGNYRIKGALDRGVSLARIAKAAYGGSSALPPDIEPGLETTDFFRPEGETFPFGTHLAVVELFRETGEIKLLRYVSIDDCGTIVSPLLVEGQVHGGLAQGIGQALFEEIRYDDNGQLLTGSLLDYTLPKAANLPMFETGHTETRTPHNPLGVKGIGEAATIGSTPAVANAVIDALAPFGIRHLDIPFTPEKIWRAMNPVP